MLKKKITEYLKKKHFSINKNTALTLYIIKSVQEISFAYNCINKRLLRRIRTRSIKYGRFMEELICQINNERKYYYGLLNFTIRNLKYAEEFTEGITSLELVEARFINLTKSRPISCLKPLLDSITKKTTHDKH